VDRVAINLPSSVREADIVFVSVPVDQMRETLALIAEDLKDDAVVMEAGPLKEVALTWAKELLPPGRHFVGLTPVINPIYLHEVESGLNAAHADLFQHGLIGIVTPPRTASEVIQLATDLTRLLGADPLFADPLEMDGLMATTHTLPQLLAVALLEATVDGPGWREARKIAGSAYAESTRPCEQFQEASNLSASALHNRANVVRALDNVIASLQALRDDIANQDVSSLEWRLERARKGRDQWLKQRLAANWAAEEAPDMMRSTSATAEILGRLLGLRRKQKD
jgi:prephenate dehydrogenase